VELFDYLPIAVMVVLGVVFAAASLFLSRLVSPSKPTPEKLAPYESGIVPEVEPVERFPVKFYLVAMLFVIFDIEIIFLFAWATRFDELGWVGVGAIAVFVALAIETLIYVWKRGALDWNPPRRERHVRETGEAA
jgi:NADH-quinone oxidoreductase subunit A